MKTGKTSRLTALLLATALMAPTLTQSQVPPYAYRIPIQGIDANLPPTGLPFAVTNFGGTFNLEVGQPASIPAPSVSGGTQPYTVSVSGTLPPGMSNSGGAISGTPLTAGQYALTLEVSDSASNTTSAQLTLNVSPAPIAAISVGIAQVPPAEAMQGTAFSTAVSASGGAGPYSFSASGLPGGISLSGATLGGTFSTAGSFNYTLTATGALTSGSRDFATVVYETFSATLSAAPQASATVDSPITPVTVQATGGKGPHSYGSTGTIPHGLSYSGGVLSGTPSTPGSYTFSLTASHAFPDAQAVEAGPFTMVVAPAPLAVSGTDLQAELAIGKTLAQQATIAGAGGTAPYAYSASGLPAGMGFSGGATTGAPTAAGTYTVTLTATDSSVPQRTGSRTFSITAHPQLTIALAKPAYLNSGSAPTGLTLSSTGGKGAGRVYTVATGTLPPGLSLNANGTFSGTPTGSGSATFKIRVQDELGTTEDTADQTIGYAPPLSINGTLADATQNQSYTAVLHTGGRGPYTVTQTSGTMPAGLSVSAGSITGYPTGSGPATLGFTVTDADGRSDSKTVSFTITSSAPVAGRSLIASASHTQLIGSGASLYLNYAPPYTTARVGSTTVPADMKAWATDQVNWSNGSPGTVLIAGNGNGGGTVKFTVNYTFNQDVLASSLDQNLAFGEGGNCNTSQNVGVLIEGSLTGGAGTYVTLANIPAVRGTITSQGTGYGGQYYALNQSFTPMTLRYVRATYTGTACINNAGSSILLRSGIVK